MLKSSFILSGLSLGVSILSLLNQLVIAHQFGSSVNLDAYFISSSVPTFVSGTITASFSYSLIPFLLRQTEKHFKSTATLIFIIVIIGATIISFTGYTFSNMFLLAKYKQYDKNIIIQVNVLSWLYCFSSILAGYFACVLNSIKRFYFPILFSSLPYLGIIISSLVCSKNFGIISIAIGMLLGSIFSCLGMFIVLNNEFIIKKDNLINPSYIIPVFQQLPFVIIGMSCFTVYQSIDAYWAPIVGSSNLAYLSYCQRIIIAIGGLVIAGPSIVLVPFLSETLSKNGIDSFLEILVRTIKFTFFICAFVVIVMSVMAKSVVKILFERGSFDEVSVNGVSSVLPYLAIGMIPMLFVIIFFRAIMLQNRERSSAILGLVSLISYFILSGIFSKWFKIEGIGFAYILSWILTVIVSIKLLWKGKVELLFRKEHYIDTLKYIILVSVITVITHRLNTVFISEATIATKSDLFFRVAFVGFISLFGYLLLSFVLRLKELQLIINKFVIKSL
jgi:putative peptidoglycan lipid II flippase